MDFETINLAIIRSRDVRSSLVKNRNFYQYLINNNVAYYYSKVLCRKRGSWEKQIIERGDRLNDKYTQTLKLINNICKKNGIDYLLFKTFKYIPEVVDGDIDLFVKEKDFYKFLEILRTKGFKCTEDERLKGKCEKSCFKKIEPRVNLSFHGLIILSEKEIWNYNKTQKVGNIKVSTTTKEFDIYSLLLGILYGPNYLNFYIYKVLENLDIRQLFSLTSNKSANSDLRKLIGDLINKSTISTKFPLFPSNAFFLTWWFKRVADNANVDLFKRLKHLAFFFYLKYKYLIFNRLHFSHK